MKYTLTRKVKHPSKGTSVAAGIDFFIPEFDDAYLFDVFAKNKKHLEDDQLYIDRHNKVIIMSPGSSVLLPSGVKTDLMMVDGAIFDENHGVMFMAANKSGVAVTMQLDAGATVIDQDYQGEIHLSVVNTSNRLIKLEQNMKLIQFLLIPVLLSKPEFVTEDKLFLSDSERKTGGFGSTS